MSGFSSKWLALREPLDLKARNRSVEDALLKTLPSSGCRILDLASGAGSTVMALSTRLGPKSVWHLTDYDPDLLKVSEQRLLDGSGGTISTQQINLASDLESLSFADVDAVTTSAFLDLVSDAFLTRLVDKVVSSHKPFLASLTYDGRMECEPADPFDHALFGGLNQHQRSDKGFGCALGPGAAGRAIEMFELRGFKVIHGKSDWHIAGHDQEFLQEFLGGCIRVGNELRLDRAQMDLWWQKRRAQIEENCLDMSVGHVDFLALPD